MEHLLSSWSEVMVPLKSTSHILLLADYDGTLTPIVDRPELANLSDEVRRLLQALVRLPLFTVGVISGRALSDLKGHVNVKGLIYVGNHGLEIETPESGPTNPSAEEIRPVLRTLNQLLNQNLSTIEGVIVEDKGLSLSVHYRQVENERSDEVKKIFDRTVSGARASGKIRITSGKKVYEVRPAVDWDKGKAVALLIEKYAGGDNLLPIYLGDDITDEDGFRAIENHGGGISVFVGDKRENMSARYFLKSPDEVLKFLNMLLDRVPRGSDERD